MTRTPDTEHTPIQTYEEADRLDAALDAAERGTPRPEWRATRDRALAILHATNRAGEVLPVLRGRRIA